MTRQSLRGAGRDLPGAGTVTMTIYHYLKAAAEQGLTFEQIVDKVAPSVPKFYAWNRYLAARDSSRRSIDTRALARDPSYTRSRTTTPDLPDTPGNRMRAVNFVIRDTLAHMCDRRYGTARRRADGTFTAGWRAPRSFYGPEVEDVDGTRARQHVADMELLRVIQPRLEAIRAKPVGPGRYQLVGNSTIYHALERWVAVHAVHLQPPEPPAETAGQDDLDLKPGNDRDALTGSLSEDEAS